MILGITNQIMVVAIEIRKTILPIALINSTNPFIENMRFNPVNGFILSALGARTFDEKLIEPPTTNWVKITAANIGKANNAAAAKNMLNAISAL